MMKTTAFGRWKYSLTRRGWVLPVRQTTVAAAQHIAACDNSLTFFEVLSADNHKTFVIPEGFAHGFQTLTDDCEMLYFHTAAYHASAEAGLNALDPGLAIEWPLDVDVLSDRDRSHPMVAKNTRVF